MSTYLMPDCSAPNTSAVNYDEVVSGFTAPSPMREEHDRLTVLCRLIVIDRIDALNECLLRLQGSNSSNQKTDLLDSCSKESTLTLADIQVEQHLLTSYLQRLGGTDFNSATSSWSHLMPNRTQASSSPSGLITPSSARIGASVVTSITSVAAKPADVPETLHTLLPKSLDQLNDKDSMFTNLTV
ncbi:unnamed protein product [Protopolystoma xenopodis]|uniref:Uncharacterized protein n=1 Tax=Protopolystoma xenopodis TaxID=117903 RepID=A0A3S5ACA6_9PLAT|nr:unnamed protein product [Protopolystoma xenopodis]